MDNKYEKQIHDQDPSMQDILDGLLGKLIREPKNCSMEELEMLSSYSGFADFSNNQEWHYFEEMSVTLENLLEFLAHEGCLESIEHLFHTIPDITRTMMENTYFPFQAAVANLDMPLLDVFVKEMPDILQEMIEKNIWWGFMHPASQNQLSPFNWFEKHLPKNNHSKEDIIWKMANSKDQYGVRMYVNANSNDKNSLHVFRWIVDRLPSHAIEEIMKSFLPLFHGRSALEYLADKLPADRTKEIIYSIFEKKTRAQDVRFLCWMMVKASDNPHPGLIDKTFQCAVRKKGLSYAQEIFEAIIKENQRLPLYVFQYLEEKLPKDSFRHLMDSTFDDERDLSILYWMAERSSPILREIRFKSILLNALEQENRLYIHQVTQKLPQRDARHQLESVYMKAMFDKNLRTIDFVYQYERGFIANEPYNNRMEEVKKKLGQARYSAAIVVDILSKYISEPMLIARLLKSAEVHPFFIPVSLIVGSDPLPLIQYHIQEEMEYQKNHRQFKCTQLQAINTQLSFFSRELNRCNKSYEYINPKEVQEFFTQFFNMGVWNGEFQTDYRSLDIGMFFMNKVMNIIGSYIPMQLDDCDRADTQQSSNFADF